MSFKVEIISDEHNCETCGFSYEEGYRIYHNGEVVSQKLPVAYCFANEGFDVCDALIEIIRSLGEHVTVEYEQEENDDEERI